MGESLPAAHQRPLRKEEGATDICTYVQHHDLPHIHRRSQEHAKACILFIPVLPSVRLPLETSFVSNYNVASKVQLYQGSVIDHVILVMEM